MTQTTTTNPSAVSNFAIYWIDDELQEGRTQYPLVIERTLNDAGFYPNKFTEVPPAVIKLLTESKETKIILLLDIKMKMEVAHLDFDGISTSPLPAKAEDREFERALLLKDYLHNVRKDAYIIYLSHIGTEAKNYWGDKIEKSIKVMSKEDDVDDLTDYLRENLNLVPTNKEDEVSRSFIPWKRFSAKKVSELKGFVEEIADNIAFVKINVEGKEIVRTYDLEFLKRRQTGFAGAPIKISIYESRDGTIFSNLEFDNESETKDWRNINSTEITKLSERLEKKRKLNE